MNRTELEAKIAEKFERVMLVQKKSDVANIGYYVATVFDVAGDVGRTVNIMFFVEDEGTVDEKAVWGASEPKPAPGDPTFAQEAQVWLQSKIDVTIGDNIIRIFDQLSADNVQERARVRLALEDVGTGTLSTVDVALWKVAGEFQYKVIAA